MIACICLRTFFVGYYFLVLLLKGIYHYWKYVFCQGLKQLEEFESSHAQVGLFDSACLCFNWGDQNTWLRSLCSLCGGQTFSLSNTILPYIVDWYIYIYVAVAQQKRYQNGTLASGNVDQNLHHPSCLTIPTVTIKSCLHVPPAVVHPLPPNYTNHV